MSRILMRGDLSEGMPDFESIKTLFLSGNVAEAEEACRLALEANPGDKAIRMLHSCCLAKLRLMAPQTSPAAQAASADRQPTAPPPEDPPMPFSPQEAGGDTAPPPTAPPRDMLEDTQDFPPPPPGTGAVIPTPRAIPPPCGGKRKRPLGWPRIVLRCLAVPSALFLILFFAAYLSVRSEKKARLPYLWTQRALGSDFEVPGGMVEVTEPEGNFSIGLPKWIDPFPEVRRFDLHLYEACAHWTYPARANEGRVDVSYVRRAPGKGVFGDGKTILAFDNSVQLRIEFGSGPFVGVLGEGIEVTERWKAKRTDKLFAEKHGASGFGYCGGTVVLDGKEYRMHQVTLTRGREAWRIQTTLQSALDAGREKKHADAIDTILAGEILGRFRILAPEACEVP
jgi:hypothetical protein